MENSVNEKMLEPFQGLETIGKLKPRTATHETIQLYAALKEQVTLNAELRVALLEAAEMINKLTERLNES